MNTFLLLNIVKCHALLIDLWSFVFIGGNRLFSCLAPFFVISLSCSAFMMVAGELMIDGGVGGVGGGSECHSANNIKTT